MAAKTKPLSCFISVPLGVNADGLRLALANLGVRIGTLDELAPAGSNFISVIEQEMRAADFVCIVLGRETNNANILFELGFAVGLNRPILIVAEDRNALPATMSGYPVVQASANDVEALSFHLRIFLQSFQQSATAAKSYRGRRRPSLGRSRSATESERTLAREGNDFEKLILSALKRKGLEVVASPPTKSSEGVVFRPDFAVWFPDAPPDIGNLIILEAKRTDRKESISNAVEQVKQYLQSSRTRTGIVICEGTKSDIDIVAADRGYVFVISINEFLRRVDGKNLIKRLVMRRNRFVHAGV